MKKILVILLGILIPTTVSAQCSYEEQANLREEANLISVNYIEKEELMDPDLYGIPESLKGNEEAIEEYEVYINYLEIEVSNLSENHYIIMTNDKNNNITRIDYDDLNNGFYTFDHDDISNIYVYTLEIYSSAATNCSDEIYGVKYLTAPRYNSNSEYSACQEFEEEELCQKYTTSPVLSEGEFFAELETLQTEIEDEQNETEKNNDKSNNFISEYWMYFMIGLIILGTATIIIIKVKKRKSEFQ